MLALCSISPAADQTPRSEKNAASLEDEEIAEEIEEQLSGGEDLLKSEASAVSISTRLYVLLILSVVHRITVFNMLYHFYSASA